ncbi:MAG: tetratricopeptide repeat protein [Chitinophagaceae bacterium]|nr:tetratricopeptide repeat protein [Chitinophagaceae bacterium]
MKKQQIILIGGGVLLFCFVYFFGRTVPPKSKVTAKTQQAASPSAHEHSVDINTILTSSKQELTVEQQAYINQLETAVVRGDVKEQQIKVYKQIAAFWRDTAHLLLPYAYYTGQASKLENSEKSLTFAAHYFLGGLRQQGNPDLKHWMAEEAKELFEKALALNPNNDSTKIGLGSCYLFGNISSNPMEGIQLIREVSERDSSNIYAQFMLGLGAMESGQFDRAVERLNKVVAAEPKNLEAVLNLAEAYERKGDKANAIKWYEAGKKFFTEKEILDEIDSRIQQLKK